MMHHRPSDPFITDVIHATLDVSFFDSETLFIVTAEGTLPMVESFGQ